MAVLRCDNLAGVPLKCLQTIPSLTKKQTHSREICGSHCSYARAGGELAMAILRCNRMACTLLAILQAPPAQPSHAGGAGGKLGGLGGDVAAQSTYSARPVAAALLRALVQSSPAAARTASSAGETRILHCFVI